MAMSLRSLLLISFLILSYFYPSFALNIARIVFFTPVIFLLMYLSTEHFVFLMTYLRQHETRVQDPRPRVVYIRERPNNTERALRCVLSEVWLFVVRAWTACILCMSLILLIYGMLAVVLYYPVRPFLWDCSVLMDWAEAYFHPEEVRRRDAIRSWEQRSDAMGVNRANVGYSYFDGHWDIDSRYRE